MKNQITEERLADCANYFQFRSEGKFGKILRQLS